jgi:hypothetical protein
VTELLALKDWYWAHREVARLSAGLAGIGLVHVVVVVWVARRLGELALMRERMSRLADGLALLTDTTEAGLATLLREVEALSKRKVTARTASRATVAKRVAAAAQNGEGVGRIAEDESLSESEVRLHLALAGTRAQASGLKGQGQGLTAQGAGLSARGPAFASHAWKLEAEGSALKVRPSGL